jgi:ubiquinone/menaquinone biosynthesis C-methylase UbiE
VRPARLEQAEELMDAPDIEPGLLRRTLLDLESVNRYLGGVRAVIDAVGPLVRAGQPLTLLDIGCGGGDLPRALVKHLELRHIPHQVVAIDRNLSTIDLARRWSMGYGVDISAADALHLPFGDATFDVVIASMTLHHFDDGPRIEVLREMARVARRRVIINDLERCWQNYVGARFLAATVWRRSLARHDGPISVRRGFTANELSRDLRTAGMSRVRVDRRFFYRLVGSGAPRRSSDTAEMTL